jgi:uncharacterized protein YciI
MKHFVVVINYIATPEQVAGVRPAHRVFLQSGYERGWLLLSGPQIPPNGGIVVARAPSLAEAQEFFSTDPYFTSGVATHQFIEFDPLKHQPWLENWVTGSDLD